MSHQSTRARVRARKVTFLEMEDQPLPPRKAPGGFRFDPFADVRMGKSLFEMRDEDWLVRETDTNAGRDGKGESK